ncbi:IS3 family transposase [Alkalinema pantanalense CENA528]|uniref:IS3 family transposase n=1 Tax=Alkalinema pantanalense TaxID=1620705 RepID=UPI003D6DC767
MQFYGSRRMTVHLQELGYLVNRKRVQRLMREMGLFALYPKPKLSQAHPEHWLGQGLQFTANDYSASQSIGWKLFFTF